jgi:hypothetical protein
MLACGLRRFGKKFEANFMALRPAPAHALGVAILQPQRKDFRHHDHHIRLNTGAGIGEVPNKAIDHGRAKAAIDELRPLKGPRAGIGAAFGRL